jgi:hypothetical protein
LIYNSFYDQIFFWLSSFHSPCGVISQMPFNNVLQMLNYLNTVLKYYNQVL